MWGKGPMFLSMLAQSSPSIYSIIMKWCFLVPRFSTLRTLAQPGIYKSNIVTSCVHRWSITYLTYLFVSSLTAAGYPVPPERPRSWCPGRRGSQGSVRRAWCNRAGAGIGLVNKFMRYIGLTSGTRSPPRCTSYSRRTEGAWRWFIDSSSGYCCQTQAFLPACQWISGSSCRCSPHTGWWQRDMRPIMLRQKSVSRRLSRAEIRSQEVVRHQIPYK